MRFQNRRHPLRELRRRLPDPLIAAEVMVWTVVVGGVGGWVVGIVLALLTGLPIGITVATAAAGAWRGERMRRRCRS